MGRIFIKLVSEYFEPDNRISSIYNELNRVLARLNLECNLQYKIKEYAYLEAEE